MKIRFHFQFSIYVFILIGLFVLFHLHQQLANNFDSIFLTICFYLYLGYQLAQENFVKIAPANTERKQDELRKWIKMYKHNIVLHTINGQFTQHKMNRIFRPFQAEHERKKLADTIVLREYG